MQQIPQAEIEEVIQEAEQKLGYDSRFEAGLKELILAKGVDVARKYLNTTDQNAIYEWSKYIGFSNITGAPKDYTFVQFALDSIDNAKRTPFMFIQPWNIAVATLMENQPGEWFS